MDQCIGPRRTFLASAASLATLASAGCLSTLGLDEGNESAETGAADGSELSTVGVESITWEDTTLVIEFDPSFEEWDGWIIHHEYEDPGEYSVIGGEYPRVAEPQELPFVTLLQEEGESNYSTTTFEISAFNGTADPWRDNRQFTVRFVREWGPSATFEVPERVLEEAGVWGGSE